MWSNDEELMRTGEARGDWSTEDWRVPGLRKAPPPWRYTVAPMPPASLMPAIVYAPGSGGRKIHDTTRPATRESSPTGTTRLRNRAEMHHDITVSSSEPAGQGRG